MAGDPWPWDLEKEWAALQEVDPLRIAEARIEALRSALVEIMSPPDESKGEGYGCASLHEARWIAAAAHTADNAARGDL